MVDPAIKATLKPLGGAGRRGKPSSPSIDRHNFWKQNHAWYLRSDLKLAAMRESSGSSSRVDFTDTYAFQTKHTLGKHPSPDKTYCCSIPSLTHLFDDVTVPIMAQMIVAACTP